jgi:hypothetical protein
LEPIEHRRVCPLRQNTRPMVKIRAQSNMDTMAMTAAVVGLLGCEVKAIAP